MIVVDASAAVAGLLTAGDARQVLAYQPVAVPHLADSEIAHALRGQVLRGAVKADQAATALDRWAHLAVARYSAVGLLRRIWELRGNISGYDATYVALAEALGCELATCDARLARAPGATCPVLVLPR